MSPAFNPTSKGSAEAAFETCAAPANSHLRHLGGHDLLIEMEAMTRVPQLHVLATAHNAEDILKEVKVKRRMIAGANIDRGSAAPHWP
eukprot:CAMPEP_0183377852 /NCGR_PEP_ID=MMETSP0164_2-20130417/124127_1 /TAXON_ID=221442 /ORGANISM="Coccolithus pelagicus ssp braarudi, Strain PLY182g" /LENGTH=87 /DNA_ID=CAMNT_0025555357 /DNA_START=179 /DNA_END=444 /DNA_ORIENTATION=+